MRELTPEAVAAAVGGRVVAGGTAARGVEIDTRRLVPGQLFAALAGERTDGHLFLAEAARRGAAGLLVSEGRLPGLELPVGPFVVAAADPGSALWRLAAAWRRGLACPVAAVTGSFGKSTTKELLAALLGGAEGGVVAARGSFNNHLGVPLTLLAANAGTRLLVVELGANGPGEIARLAGLARPVVGVITGVGPVHLEGFGDEAGVAREKGALAEAVPPAGRLVLDREGPWFAALAARARCPVVDVALADRRARWVPEALEPAPGGCRIRIRGHRACLPLPGRHNAVNLLLALAAAEALGREPGEALAGLAAFRPVPGRLAPERLAGGTTLLDDTYNSNFPAACAALDVLAAWPCQGRRIAVFGEMRELGPAAPEWHRRLGAAAAAARLDRLVLVGGSLMDEAAKGAEAGGLAGERLLRLPAAGAAAAVLPGLVAAGDLVLLKGSRTARLDVAAAALRARAGAREEAGHAP